MRGLSEGKDGIFVPCTCRNSDDLIGYKQGLQLGRFKAGMYILNIMPKEANEQQHYHHRLQEIVSWAYELHAVPCRHSWKTETDKMTKLRHFLARQNRFSLAPRPIPPTREK